MTSGALSRKQREYIRHRNEILDAALRLFSEKGFHNVSMQEIASEAEFAIGTLYRFFDTKEDLYKSLVLRLAQSFHARLASVLDAQGDEIEKLRNYVQEKGNLFSENLTMIRLYFSEIRGASFNIKAGLDAELRKSHNTILKKLAKVFDDGISNNTFNKIADPYSLAVGFDSISNGFLFLWLESPKKHPYPEKIDIIMQMFFNQLLRNR